MLAISSVSLLGILFAPRIAEVFDLAALRSLFAAMRAFFVSLRSRMTPGFDAESLVIGLFYIRTRRFSHVLLSTLRSRAMCTRTYSQEVVIRLGEK
jgi:hypothetical protein